jgi:hypothetical protein
MITVLIHLRALKTTLCKLTGVLMALYKNELSFHWKEYGVCLQLKEGWKPEALARQVCVWEGSEIPSNRYQELLAEAQRVKEKFHLA